MPIVHTAEGDTAEITDDTIFTLYLRVPLIAG